MKERSFFFPLALIATGVIWMLVTAGKIPAENLWALARFWPILLIAAGLGLILRSYWAPARLLVDLVVIGGAVLAIVFAPQLGWNSPQWGMDAHMGGGVPGSGKLMTETRPIAGAVAISVAYPAEVLIQQGSAETVTVEAEDNLLPQLATSVRAGTLYIENNEPDWSKRVNPSKPVRITITVRDLNNVDFSSAGELRITGLETDQLTIDLSGAGDLMLESLSARRLNCHLSGAGSFTASGSADSLSLEITGMGDFKGEKLSSLNVDVRISGAGSAIVSAKDTLNASISGAGSVKYFGSPQVTQTISGVGSVDPADQ